MSTARTCPPLTDTEIMIRLLTSHTELVTRWGTQHAEIELEGRRIEVRWKDLGPTDASLARDFELPVPAEACTGIGRYTLDFSSIDPDDPND